MKLNNEQEYEEALRRLKGLSDSQFDEELFDAIWDYEELYYPINTDFVDDLKDLTEGVEIDLDAPLEGDVDLE